MLTVNHFIILFLIFISFVLIGGILRVVYNSNAGVEILIRIKSLLVLQFIFPLFLPIIINRHRDELRRLINNSNIEQDRKKRLILILDDENEFKNFRRAVYTMHIFHFKGMLDQNIKRLNNFKNEKGKELNISVSISFKGFLDTFILLQGFMTQKEVVQNYSENLKLR